MFDGQADEAMELGIQFEDFNRIYRGQKAKVFKGAAKKVISTLQWQDVNQLLQTAGPMSQNIEVSKEGQRLSPSAYMDATHGEPAKRISPSALNRAIADGHSIILNYLDTYHQPANELCSALTSALQEHVNLNAYISMVSNKCFTTHWDDHDVFIIQTQGRKHWSVFEPTRKFPLKHDVVCKNMPEGIDLFWEGELNQGDLLYIPRGWWHHASATDVGSIHITAGFSNRRPVHLLNFLVNEASEHEWMRMDLNRVGDRDHTDLLEKIARYFKDRLNEGLIDRYFAHHQSKLPSRHCHALPILKSRDRFEEEDPILEYLALVPALPTRQASNEICIEFGQRRWTFDGRVEHILNFVANKRQFKLSELVSHVSGSIESQTVSEFVGELIGEGILGVRT